MSIKISNVLNQSKRTASVVLILLTSFSPIFIVFSPVTASADPTTTIYSLPTDNYYGKDYPADITTGPDGALWFTEETAGKIGHITTAGIITDYTLPDGGDPTDITTGPDGALWFTEHGNNVIGRITTTGSVTTYPIPSSTDIYGQMYPANPNGITTGPDGALWFTEESPNKIGRITTSGSLTEYQLPGGVYSNVAPLNITTGPDGALWFTLWGTNGIGRITTTGDVTEYPDTLAAPGGGGPYNITTGPDGALWFDVYYGNQIGRITTSGSITGYQLPSGGSPVDITTGPDGALWFMDELPNGTPGNIGRLSTSGVFNEYPLTENNSPFYGAITAGPDGALWFTWPDINSIGRITTPAPTPPTNLTIASPTQDPVLSWNTVSGDDSYNIYRNGVQIGSSTISSYTDSAAPEGTDSYYVTAVNGGGESSPSNGVSVVVDRTAPTVSNLGFTTDPLSTGQQTSLNASITDSLSGVARAEYYTGTDPGAGNGTAMALVNGTATAPIGPYSTAGMYTYYVRALDNAGNWSQPQSVTLDVYNPSGGYAAGHGFVSPGSASSNPGDYLPNVSGSNVKATFDFTVKYDTATATTPTGASTFSWGSGNCKKAGNSCFVVTADSLDWLVVPGDNTAIFQGTGTVSLNSQTLGTDYVVRVSAVGTTTTSPGHYELQVFASGANPDTATPLYQASGDLTGGAVVLHA